MLRTPSRRSAQVALVAAAALLLPNAAFAAKTSSRGPFVVHVSTVGSAGYEPIIVEAPDGTLYDASLTHLSRSVDGGKHWQPLAGPSIAQAVVASDSTLSVDPSGRVYFAFDYPYLGPLAVCTSEDRGTTWSCDDAAFPGGTDRQWLASPTTDNALITFTDGLYANTFGTTKDGGKTWLPAGAYPVGAAGGPLLRTKQGGWLEPLAAPDSNGHIQLLSFSGDGSSPAASVMSTTVPAGSAVPNLAMTSDGTLYLATQIPSQAGGTEVVVGRSTDNGATWTLLPPLPETVSGTANYAWTAANKRGEVGVLYYYSRTSGTPSAMPTTASWSIVWAETKDADTATPHWDTTTLEADLHNGSLCSGVGATCQNDDRYSGDFITGFIDRSDTAHVTWVRDAPGNRASFVAGIAVTRSATVRWRTSTGARASLT